ncbi:MAG: hypothetical protein GQ477_03920, partial [Nanohaloarchaea archaeon]|nr:hypothetical protein [Candidatus Nanohaloarchaea archaeon]
LILLLSITPIHAEIYSPVVGQVTEDDTSIFLVDVTKEDVLTITVSLNNLDLVSTIPDDEITLVSIYDPLGKMMTDEGCTGKILKTCKIYNPTPGTWLVEVDGDRIYGDGKINVQASYLINNYQIYYDVYELDDYIGERYDMAQYSMFFLEKYISTSDRDHFALIGEWDDYVAKNEISIIAPNIKTKTDTSKEDETNVQAYYLTPGGEAEGNWLVLLRALKGSESIDLYTNYGYLDAVPTQQLISDEIKKADEAKEYPILVTDTSTPLVLSLLEKQSGDTVIISKVFNPSGVEVACTDFGAGCAIQDPEEGIWLVDIAAQSITGAAPFNFASTHQTYEPKDYTLEPSIDANYIIFYESYIKTQDKEHMVTVADWEDSLMNIEISIISANVQTKTAHSAGAEKNVRLYSLSPGNVAEGKWIVQLASLEGNGTVDISSNYNLTRVATQETRFIETINMDENQKFLINVTVTDIPLVVSLLEKQSGDDLIISTVVNPEGKQVTCTSFASGCAIQDPKPGIWTVNVKGKSITGQAPYVFASTYPLTDCGNEVCEVDIGENCRTCASDCACNQFEKCGLEDVCISITKEVEKGTVKDKIKDNISNIIIVLLVIAGIGYKVYKNKSAF